jgi:sulfur relay (sulfurtransferase) complex TusBCD TusD component (DsrE family)
MTAVMLTLEKVDDPEIERTHKLHEEHTGWTEWESHLDIDLFGTVIIELCKSCAKTRSICMHTKTLWLNEAGEPVDVSTLTDLDEEPVNLICMRCSADVT